ncbi:MAG: tetratricopeptide repeat protein, partial [Sphingobacterium sp.]
MEEDFEFGSPEEQRFSVDRYEEMLRNEDQYFFDAKAFEGIIDYYIYKNDPIKALQVVEFAGAQHPFETTFLIKKAQ